MNHMSLILLIIQAIFLLIFFGLMSELLAMGAEFLESYFGVGFVGSVILGFITMLPELLFVIIAVREQETEVALGSSIGGNILLFTIGYGMVILLALIKHRKIIHLPTTMRDDLVYLFLSTVYIVFASLDGTLGLIDGIVLTLAYVIFVIHQYIETRNLPRPEHSIDSEPVDDRIERTVKFYNAPWFRILMMALGTLGIIIAAEPFVHVIVEISVIIRVPPLVLALIISPIASELPEKISAFVLTYRSMTGAQIAIANFVGSKVQANTLLFGAMILLNYYWFQHGVEISGYVIPLMVAVLTTVVGIVISLDLKLKLKEGWVIFILYFVSIAVVIYVY